MCLHPIYDDDICFCRRYLTLNYECPNKKCIYYNKNVKIIKLEMIAECKLHCQNKVEKNIEIKVEINIKQKPSWKMRLMEWKRRFTELLHL